MTDLHGIGRTRGSRRAFRAVAALAAAAFVTLGTATLASALPPDGPGPETPGTSSRVWPTEVQAGDLLYFEVSGYPANETVYIKIDDGLACTDTSHGACVYATQALDSNGYASGSIVVPNLAAGAHWLRMLATGDVFDDVTGEKLGYEGYTRRGGNDFTVIAGGSGGGSAAGGASGQGAAVAGGGAANSDGSIAGGSIALDVEESAGETDDESADGETAAAEDSMDDITTDYSAEDTVGSTQDETEDADVQAFAIPEVQQGPNVPVLGMVVLGSAIVIGAGVVGWALMRKQRLEKAAANTAG